jgi:hypothetical protein
MRGGDRGDLSGLPVVVGWTKSFVLRLFHSEALEEVGVAVDAEAGFAGFGQVDLSRMFCLSHARRGWGCGLGRRGR